MRKNSKAQLIVRNRKIMLSVVILATLLFSIILFTNKAAAENSRHVYTYYTSYQIQSGDTLWTIADKFMGPDYTNKKDFIDNIKTLNHLGDGHITEGKFLVIEYSSYEKL